MRPNERNHHGAIISFYIQYVTQAPSRKWVPYLAPVLGTKKGPSGVHRLTWSQDLSGVHWLTIVFQHLPEVHRLTIACSGPLGGSSVNDYFSRSLGGPSVNNYFSGSLWGPSVNNYFSPSLRGPSTNNHFFKTPQGSIG